MTQQFDLIIIGTGTAASVAASKARDADWNVAVIDEKPFGGTCALRGCDPKKVLRDAAVAVDHARRMTGKGLCGKPDIHWPDLIAFKRGFTDPVPDAKEKSYAENGISSFHGKARFKGPNSVDVDGVTLKGRRILIATGARPATLDIPGEQHLIDSEAFMALGSLPKSIVMVGGGFIAAEFSHVAARAGSAVTILQQGDRILTEFDPDLVGWLMPKFEAIGVDIHAGASVSSIEKTDDHFRIGASTGDESRTFEADLVVHAASRVPNIQALDLDKAGIAVKDGRLVLNHYMQSVSNEAIYAAGDAAACGPALTPVASDDAKVVIANLLKGNTTVPDYGTVPSVAFTIPPIASVGLSERQACEEGLNYSVRSRQVSEWFTARHTAEPVYGFKVLVEDGSDLILGAHLVGPHADEIINLFAMAISHGIPATAFKHTMFAYPTAASDIAHML